MNFNEHGLNDEPKMPTAESASPKCIPDDKSKNFTRERTQAIRSLSTD